MTRAARAVPAEPARPPATAAARSPSGEPTEELRIDTSVARRIIGEFIRGQLR